MASVPLIYCILLLSSDSSYIQVLKSNCEQQLLPQGGSSAFHYYYYCYYSGTLSLTLMLQWSRAALQGFHSTSDYFSHNRLFDFNSVTVLLSCSNCESLDEPVYRTNSTVYSVMIESNPANSSINA